MGRRTEPCKEESKSTGLNVEDVKEITTLRGTDLVEVRTTPPLRTTFEHPHLGASRMTHVYAKIPDDYLVIRLS